MAFKKKTEKTDNKVNYDIKVTRVNQINDTLCGFSMNVNGISISNCTLREYKNKEGVDGYIVNFPSRASGKKDADGKEIYYSYAWFPLSKEDRIKIVDQVMALLG